METRKNRMSIARLRQSDPNTLMVLTQDAISLPIGQLEPSTLVDLLALSELGDQLSTALARDLNNFRIQIFRQIDDLPDGPALAGFVNELAALEPARLPQTLREFLSELLPQKRHPESLQALQDLATRLEGTSPEVLTLPAPKVSPPPAAASTRKPASKPKAAAGAPAKKKRTRVTASQVDDRRAEWIEEDVISRLVNYGNRGLKESIVVAGARHRSSWPDLSAAEILAVLRRLKRESKVRFSAGRWIIG